MIRARFTYICVMSALAATVYGCAGYAPGRQSYWDQKISELCGREGAIKIFETVRVSPTQTRTMARLEGKLATRPKQLALSSDPVYTETRVTYLHEFNPRVTREDVSVIRSADGKIVAQWTEYARVGGDMPIGIAHESAFRCPDPRRRLEELQRLFILSEDKPTK